MKFFLRIFLLVLIACQSAPAQDLPLIVSSINPIHQIIFAITKDKSNNVLIINSSLSEHDYALKKSDIKSINQADLIFYVNDDLEKNFAKLVASSNKNSHAFELTKLKNIKLLQKRNDVKKIDPHIWLNPENAVKIAELVAQKISEIDAKNAAYYYKNLAEFKKEIWATEKKIKLQLSKIKPHGYIFFHDGYQYFENYFGLTSPKIISSDHDQDLSIKDFKELDILINQGQIKCILGEKFDEKNTAMKLARNYKINFTLLDGAGKQSGYTNFLLKISSEIFNCAK